MLFFTAATITFLGFRLKQLKEGHAVLMQRAFVTYQKTLSAELNQQRMILGNQRTDVPALRDNGTVSVLGITWALVLAQTVPKYRHGMRQPWHHPTNNLWRVQQALYDQLLLALTTPDPDLASEQFGSALHTLQDTYTIGHTDRINNGDPFSPIIRLNYSPSRAHPFISPNDTVWANEEQQTLTPPAQAAVQATHAAFDLWSELWCASAVTARPIIEAFVKRYVPVREQPFSPRD